MDVVHPRCTGIDISKKDTKVCVRIQGRGNRRTSSTGCPVEVSAALIVLARKP
ncbi:hypothetical protein [Rhodococcus wratislaviensis]|uniref:hypothetical protein n=1 Tax=Rhodococcus wratislaviensis TaxID=44752 RepID=UPI0036514AC6